MSEPDEVQADEASANGQEPGGETQEHSWLVGDPDPNRLVSYATNLRNERAELKERLAKAEGTWDDEDEWVKRGEERFPHRFVQDSEETDVDDTEYDEEDDPRDRELSELKEQAKAHDEWIRQQQNDSAMQQFKRDADELAAVSEVELDEEDRRLIYQKGQELGGSKGWGRKELEKAVAWLVERDRRIEQRGLERTKSSKRAPHVPTGGSAGKGPTPDLDTLEGRKALYDKRIAERG